MKCNNCKRIEHCTAHSVEYDSCVKSGYSYYIPYTNADRIRTMSVEKLAKLAFDECGCPPDAHTRCDEYDNDELCRKCWLDWLNQEATE